MSSAVEVQPNDPCDRCGHAAKLHPWDLARPSLAAAPANRCRARSGSYKDQPLQCWCDSFVPLQRAQNREGPAAGTRPSG